MPSYAVKVTDLNSRRPETKQGILVSNPQVGNNCIIYLGDRSYLSIATVQGWIAPVNEQYIILFDAQWKRYRLEVIASSDDFL